MISVAILKPDEALRLPWDDLRPYANNVFMTPAALKAAADTLLAAIYVLVAFETGTEPARLVGYWAVQIKQLGIWPFIEALPFNYAFLATPVLHPDYADDVVPAFLAALSRDPRLPSVVVARDLDASGREHSALSAALARHHQTPLRSTERPIATRGSGIKRTGSTRKKLRQTWNRLAAEGAVTLENVRDPARIGAALESFLELEAKSWKGGQGTALLSHRKDAAFARRLVADLAQDGRASVAVLSLEGRAIATQVVLYCGVTAYTWKTSFDPAFSRFSPGALLIDRLATDLLDSGAVELIDSCSNGEGFMGQLLAGRKPMADLVFSATPRASVGYLVISAYLRLREAGKVLRARLRGEGRRANLAGASAPGASLPATVDPVPPGSSSPAPTVDRAA